MCATGVTGVSLLNVVPDKRVGRPAVNRQEDRPCGSLVSARECDAPRRGQ
jgi:hypothetical protein